MEAECSGCDAVQKVISFVSAGAVATLFVMVPYIVWPF